jgi:hypothetical protein
MSLQRRPAARHERLPGGIQVQVIPANVVIATNSSAPTLSLHGLLNHEAQEEATVDYLM